MYYFRVQPSCLKFRVSPALYLNSLPDEVDLRRDFLLHDASARASWCEMAAEHESHLPGLEDTSYKVEAIELEDYHPHTPWVK